MWIFIYVEERDKQKCKLLTLMLDPALQLGKNIKREKRKRDKIATSTNLIANLIANTIIQASS
jgi:hypothetical protein